jgi:hypothetical protein
MMVILFVHKVLKVKIKFISHKASHKAERSSTAFNRTIAGSIAGIVSTRKAWVFLQQRLSHPGMICVTQTTAMY